MPHSRNPASYESFYWELLEAARNGVEKLVFTTQSPQQAKTVQITFYAFYRALESEAEKLKKAGDMTSAAKRIEEANACRGYLVTSEGSTLTFVMRDLNAQTKGLREQLHAQLESMDDFPPSPE